MMYDAEVLLPAPNLALESDLVSILGRDRVSTNPADRVAYSRDLWPRQQIRTRAGDIAPVPPNVIVWPARLEQVQSVVEYAHDRGIELVPYGAGSGVCGGISPSAGAIMLDLKHMRAVRSIDRDRLECVAEAGIIGQHLEDRLDANGFTLGHFPSSIYCSTLGGWLAARSAGQCSGRYGKIEDMALALTCVDGQGKVLSGRRGANNEALLPLLIGSEGTLGVITEATLRIAPKPERRVFASYAFHETAVGLEAIRTIYQSGLRPAVARLYDPFDSMLARRGGVKSKPKGDPRPSRGPGLGVKLLTRALRFPGALNRLIETLPERSMGGAMLILVWESAPEIAEAEKHLAHEICTGLAGEDLGEGPGHRWLRHRHSVAYRQSPIFAAGAFVDTMEVASTWSRLLPMYLHVREVLHPHVFVMAHFSHAYPDGASIYFTFAGSAKDDAASLEHYDRTWRDALAAVVESGGTLSHHHGVGRSKAPMMRREQGIAVDVIRELKRELDPKGILNPGALIPVTNDKVPTRASRTVENSGTEILSIDDISMIVHAQGDARLRDVEFALNRHDLSLGITRATSTMTVREWIDRGAPGATTSSDDPVQQTVAGIEVELPNGQILSIHPAPRRAVGPDLVGAVMGAQGALGAVRSAHLVARPKRTPCSVSYLFADRQSAEAALAWLRGRGVRPTSAEIAGAPEGASLLLRLELTPQLERAFLGVIRSTVAERGGSEVDALEVQPPAKVTSSPLSSIIERFAARLPAIGSSVA